MKFQSTIMSICIHPESVHPVFGENVTTISLDDEAAGMFFVITQNDQKIRIELNELALLLESGKKLINQK